MTTVSKLKDLGYSQKEIILIGKLLSDAVLTVDVITGSAVFNPIMRNSAPGRRLVAQAKRHAEQVRMSWEYCRGYYANANS